MNRNRVNKKRMGGARVLSRAAAGMLAAALCFQPMTALAGPAGDSSLTSSSSNAGPGGGSGSSNSGSTGSSGGSTSVSNGSVSAVTSGLGVYRVTENEGIGAIARGVDVSYWQQNVNWSQVASDNVQFAMLATRFRGNVDPFFYERGKCEPGRAAAGRVHLFVCDFGRNGAAGGGFCPESYQGLSYLLSGCL